MQNFSLLLLNYININYFVLFPCYISLLYKVVKMNSELLQNMMSTLLNNVMAEECRNQWSMSRPLLVLILLYEDFFR